VLTNEFTLDLYLAPLEDPGRPTQRMTFYSFGLNHEKAPVKLRERFALSADQVSTLYREVELSSGAELVVLSTCNRTEAYLFGTADDRLRVRSVISRLAATPWPVREAFEYVDEMAIRHVLRVACGLKSLVLGDSQILAQMKEAYRRADEAEMVGAVMHRLVHSAFRTAKRTASETGLSAGAASVSSMAVAMAREFFERSGRPGLKDTRAVVFGAGEMGRLAVHALRAHDLEHLTVINRTPEKARELAQTVDASVVQWNDRFDAIREADIVLVTTSSDSFVVLPEHLVERERPVVLVDVSVPRNVHPDIDALPNCRVFDLDALNSGLVKVEAARRTEIPSAERICDEMMVEFVGWVIHQQAMQPAIQSIRQTFDEIRNQEIARHAHRFADMDRAELERLTNSILQKLLAVPVVRLKNLHPESLDFVRGIQILSGLFSRPGCDAAAARTEEDHPVPPIELPGRCPHDGTPVRSLTYDDLAGFPMIRGEA
jgi:glutamyl-tRNA reductase